MAALAVVVALVHGALVLFMVTGGLLGLRHRRLLYLHAPLTLAILGINLAHAPCPVTSLQLRLRALAGEPPYRDGFLGHYVVDPLGLHLHSPAVQAGMYAIALVPNAVAYGLLVSRAAGTRGALRGSARRP